MASLHEESPTKSRHQESPGPNLVLVSHAQAKEKSGRKKQDQSPPDDPYADDEFEDMVQIEAKPAKRKQPKIKLEETE